MSSAAGADRQHPVTDLTTVQRCGRDRQAAVLRVSCLAASAGRAPVLPHRLQESGHRAAALDGQLVGRARSERTATEQQILARAALERLQNAVDLLTAPPRATDYARHEQIEGQACRARGQGGRRGRAHRLGQTRDAHGGRHPRGLKDTSPSTHLLRPPSPSAASSRAVC
jgi:hypothetical protein